MSQVLTCYFTQFVNLYSKTFIFSVCTAENYSPWEQYYNLIHHQTFRRAVKSSTEVIQYVKKNSKFPQSVIIFIISVELFIDVSEVLEAKNMKESVTFQSITVENLT
jgi:hypothetical protein